MTCPVSKSKVTIRSANHIKREGIFKTLVKMDLTPFTSQQHLALQAPTLITIKLWTIGYFLKRVKYFVIANEPQKWSKKMQIKKKETFTYNCPRLRRVTSLICLDAHEQRAQRIQPCQKK